MQEIIKGNQHRIMRFDTVGSDFTKVEVDLFYEKGGESINGRSTPRGLHVVVCPVEVKDGWKTTTAYSGFREFVFPMKRANQKTFDEFYGKMDKFLPRYLELIEQKTGLEVIK